MSTDALQIVLVLVGTIVAFLLGNELATGYSLWKARCAERHASPDRGPDRIDP